MSKPPLVTHPGRGDTAGLEEPVQGPSIDAKAPEDLVGLEETLASHGFAQPRERNLKLSHEAVRYLGRLPGGRSVSLTFTTPSIHALLGPTAAPGRTLRGRAARKVIHSPLRK